MRVKIQNTLEQVNEATCEIQEVFDDLFLSRKGA